MTKWSYKLVEALRAYDHFDKTTVKKIFEQSGEHLSDKEINMLLHRLKTRGMVANIGRGIYKLGRTEPFNPIHGQMVRSIAALMKNEYPFLDYVLWSTQWLNDLAVLQLMRETVTLEVGDRQTSEVVFHKLNGEWHGRVFFDPTEKEWNNYATDGNDMVIVKPMLTESPKNEISGCVTAKLEKILVDLYCDKLMKWLFSSELSNIISEACSNYEVNFTTMLSYAARRGRKEEIKNYLFGAGVISQEIFNIL